MADFHDKLRGDLTALRQPTDDELARAQKIADDRAASGTPMPVLVFDDIRGDLPSGSTFHEVEPPPEPTDAERASVSALANLVLIRRRAVIDATARLRRELDDLRRLEEQDLPNAMAEIGQSEFALLDGTPVKLKTTLRSGDVTDPERITWVEGHGGRPLVKCTLTIEFDAEDAEKADALYAELRGHRFANRFKSFELGKRIKWNTMTKWLGELIDQLKDPPLERLGVQRVTRAQVGARVPESVKLNGLVDR